MLGVACTPSDEHAEAEHAGAVHWAVIAEPLRISAEQIEALDAALPENNRPVQPLGRER
jgi:carbonic anhydrase